MSQEPPIHLDISPLWPAFLVKFVPPVDPEAVANEIKNLRLADPTGRLKSNYGGWQSKLVKAPKFEKTLPALSVVRQTCARAVSELCKHQYPYKKGGITRCEWWANINKPGEDYNVGHHHGEVYAACVYYAQVPEQAGKLIIESPVNHGHEAWHGAQVVRPETGQVLIFPGSYRHMVLPTDSSACEERISVAFNFDINE